MQCLDIMSSVSHIVTHVTNLKTTTQHLNISHPMKLRFGKIRQTLSSNNDKLVQTLNLIKISSKSIQVSVLGFI